MTWNTHGLDDRSKRRKLDQLQKDLSIDLMFFQEGSAGYDNPLEEGYNGSTAFPIKDPGLALLFAGKTVVKPVGGKARRTPYNVKFDPDKWEVAQDEEEVNYAENPAIQHWITEPYDKAKKDGKITTGGTGRRATLKAAPENAGILDEVRTQVQKRVNLLSQQRPKCLRSKEDDRKIFFFHSPLGGEVRMSDVGLDKCGKTDFSASAAYGSGGQVAPTVNALFRLAICGYDEHNRKVNPLPMDVIYVGDTNVQGEGMDKLFPDANRATSNDGLCHILTRYDMEIVSTSQSDADAGKSDHDWVIADIENPT